MNLYDPLIFVKLAGWCCAASCATMLDCPFLAVGCIVAAGVTACRG